MSDDKRIYCNQCNWHMTIDRPNGRFISCGIFKSCFDYELNHKGQDFRVFNFERGQEIVDTINRVMQTRLAKIATEESRRRFGISMPLLETSIKFFPIVIESIAGDIGSFKCSSDEMENFLTSILDNCAMNLDFNCEFYKYYD